MQILSVSLKNFKTHQDQHFTFALGTNAICGENGAGKTSILEAIAWVLFNYQGSYAKEDLVRNGSGSAEVIVEFISSVDSRTYAVQRHTAKGYALFDPQLNQRLPYTRIKDEVLPWLREHLGVSPATDLGELFARMVGVPQGTFTADFLQSPENRKTVFDKILKVEAYKTVHRDLNSLRRYAEVQVESVERDIAHYDDRLQAWEPLQQRLDTLVAAQAQDQAHLKALEEEITGLQQARERALAQVQRVQQIQGEVQNRGVALEGKRQTQTLLQHSLDQAQRAVEVCNRTRSAYGAYQAAEAELQALASAQAERQVLQKRQQQLQHTLETRAADLTRLQVQLDTCAAAIAEIEQIQPLVQEQARWEANLVRCQQEQQALAQVRGQVQALEQQRSQLETQATQATQIIARLDALAANLTSIPELEQQRDRLQQQLSRLEAARQFEAELRQLVTRGEASCDRHRAKTATALDTLATWQQRFPQIAPEDITVLQTALESGIAVNQDLVQTLHSILTDLATQTNTPTLQAQLDQVRQRLTELGRHQGEVATLPQWQQHQVEVQQQRTNLAEHLKALHQQLTRIPALEAEIVQVQGTLAALQDPRGRCSLLARSRQQLPTLEQRYREIQAAQGGIQAQLAAVATQLESFADLEATIAQQQQAKQAHQADYRHYLQSEPAAQDQPRLVQEVATAQQEMEQLQAELALAQQQLYAAQADYDPLAAQQMETTYQDLRSQRDRLVGSLPQQQRLLQEVQQQLAGLKDLAAKRADAIADKQQRDRVKRFISFARKAYKEAGPRITERYVQQVSREADRLFRELLNRQNIALTWTRDYDIQVQEGPNTRRFMNLSGGEQMCAALAVRLALLKVLADIDIAFFDEPTTNMDRPRRARLAEAIGRIKSFKQLFVISHDDTFETVTENVIFVERQDAIRPDSVSS
ncbi:AAA family ATPase [Leptolyngbya sp. PCC 6406]|uniref:AAA family ATPase n=1 Tax=Leptolyngbya sp. PCC 6406 TaxID=1173264 RepID=UPI0002ACCB33|nr:SMC family ATPase [Leptolyngbya sp. PCC 6406]